MRKYYLALFAISLFTFDSHAQSPDCNKKPACVYLAAVYTFSEEIPALNQTIRDAIHDFETGMSTVAEIREAIADALKEEHFLFESYSRNRVPPFWEPVHIQLTAFHNHYGQSLTHYRRAFLTNSMAHKRKGALAARRAALAAQRAGQYMRSNMDRLRRDMNE